MAFALLDGSNGNITVTLNSISFTCVYNYWSADVVREFTEKTTFCSGGWRSRDPGMIQLIGRLEGFASVGFAGADPLALISADSVSGMPFTLQANTGCYFTGNCHIGRSHTGTRAMLNTESGIDFESDGVVMTHWIVT